jgi:hypothetical protein
MDDGVGGSGASGCMNLPFVEALRRVKAPKAPRRLGSEGVFASSSGRVRGAEGAVGGAAEVDAGIWADMYGNRRATTRSLQDGERLLPTDPNSNLTQKQPAPRFVQTTSPRWDGSRGRGERKPE